MRKSFTGNSAEVVIGVVGISEVKGQGLYTKSKFKHGKKIILKRSGRYRDSMV